MTTTIGTSHFVSLESAWGYYRPYGHTMADVQQMIKRGEIHIGKPVCKPGERVVTIRGEGRYALSED